MSKVHRCLVLLVVSFAIIARTEKSQHLQISSLAIKIGDENKEQGTFSGIYPLTVLPELKVTLDTQIMVSFRVSTVEKSEEFILPIHRLVIFQSKSGNRQHFMIAKKENEELVVSTLVGKILQRTGKLDEIEVMVKVGGPQYHEDVLWKLGTLKTSSEEINENPMEPFSPLQFEKHESKLGDIPQPDSSDDLMTVLLCCACSLSLLPVFLFVVKKFQLGFLGFQSSESKVLVMSLLTGATAAWLFYILGFVEQKVTQILLPVFLSSVICFGAGYYFHSAAASETVANTKSA